MTVQAGAQAGYGVMRTLQTLELLAQGPLTAVDLADTLMIHVRTARRILQRLVIEGFAQKRESRAPFEPTPELRKFGRHLAHLSKPRLQPERFESNGRPSSSDELAPLTRQPVVYKLPHDAVEVRDLIRLATKILQGHHVGIVLEQS